jgi:hypothetical protein
MGILVCVGGNMMQSMNTAPHGRTAQAGRYARKQQYKLFEFGSFKCLMTVVSMKCNIDPNNAGP